MNSVSLCLRHFSPAKKNLCICGNINNLKNWKFTTSQPLDRLFSGLKEIAFCSICINDSCLFYYNLADILNFLPSKDSVSFPILNIQWGRYYVKNEMTAGRRRKWPNNCLIRVTFWQSSVLIEHIVFLGLGILLFESIWIFKKSTLVIRLLPWILSIGNCLHSPSSSNCKHYHKASLEAQTVKRLPTMREIQVQSLGQEEGNGNPLQYPCLENPTVGGTW